MMWRIDKLGKNKQTNGEILCVAVAYSRSWWQQSDLQIRPAIVTSHQLSVNAHIWELYSRYEGFRLIDTNQIGREGLSRQAMHMSRGGIDFES